MSHLRVGSFQRLATWTSRPISRRLVDRAIRHYWPGRQPPPIPSAGLFDNVARAVAALGGQWFAGFVHGVLNTDNISITGELRLRPGAFSTVAFRPSPRRLFRPDRPLLLRAPARSPAMDPARLGDACPLSQSRGDRADLRGLSAHFRATFGRPPPGPGPTPTAGPACPHPQGAIAAALAFAGPTRPAGDRRSTTAPLGPDRDGLRDDPRPRRRTSAAGPTPTRSPASAPPAPSTRSARIRPGAPTRSATDPPPPVTADQPPGPSGANLDHAAPPAARFTPQAAAVGHAISTFFISISVQ